MHGLQGQKRKVGHQEGFSVNVTLKYMPQTKKTKECTGYMAMKLNIRKGSPAGLAAETGCHMCSLVGQRGSN